MKIILGTNKKTITVPWNYVAVGRIVSRSGSTVLKYVHMRGVPQNMQIAVQNLLNEKK